MVGQVYSRCLSEPFGSTSLATSPHPGATGHLESGEELAEPVSGPSCPQEGAFGEEEEGRWEHRAQGSVSVSGFLRR